MRRRRRAYFRQRPTAAPRAAAVLPWITDDESLADRRRQQYSLAIALLLHAVLFAVTIPALESGPAAKPAARPIFVVKPVRFKPPQTPPEEVAPQEPQRQVPVPDPTPDDPEPLRLVVEPAPPRELPDVVWTGIPEAPPPLPEGPLRVGGDVMPPVKLYAPQPVYPEIARRARTQGTVIVDAVIDNSGAVTQIELVQGRPMGLDRAAMDAVKQWRFRPATRGGRPVAVIFRLSVKFELR